ncbi:MAG: type I-E CRISPR-associated protein Cse2/CasB [Clostridia bacterium]|nr:type I-E CRISPR-associated protein Cse2/CasB [Clostridia bacterium]
MPEHKWDVSRLSAGERSALKRNAGVMMNDAGMQALEAFYRALDGKCGPYAEKAWFAALCMQCLWREEEQPQKMPFPEMLRAVYQHPDATDSARKRCTNYLDLSWSDDGFLLGKICALARKMRADNAALMPDFEQLADDLAHWNHAERYVQRRWLNIICASGNERDKKEEEENHAD